MGCMRSEPRPFSWPTVIAGLPSEIAFTALVSTGRRVRPPARRPIVLMSVVRDRPTSPQSGSHGTTVMATGARRCGFRGRRLRGVLAGSRLRHRQLLRAFLREAHRFPAERPFRKRLVRRRPRTAHATKAPSSSLGHRAPPAKSDNFLRTVGVATRTGIAHRAGIAAPSGRRRKPPRSGLPRCSRPEPPATLA